MTNRKRLVAFGGAAALGLSTLIAGPAATADRNLNTADLRLDGPFQTAQAGRAIATAGDVDGDGYDDMIVGVSNADFNTKRDSGCAYIVFGGPGLTSGPIGSTRTVRIDGAAEFDYTGSSVAGAGDMNNDGYGDVLIGGSGVDPKGRTDAGAAYVVYGKAAPTDVDLNAPANGWFRIDGENNGDGLSDSIAGGGDINNDGFDDVLLGAPNSDLGSYFENGSAYAILGAATPGTEFDLRSRGTSAIRISGGDSGDRIGDSLALGDVTGDGYDDILIGGQDGFYVRGQVWLVNGSATPADLTLGEPTYDGLFLPGFLADVLTAVDLNDDGFDDIIMGGPEVNAGAKTKAGRTFVVFGSGTPEALFLDELGAKGVVIEGAAAADHAGASLAPAGDVNRDGAADLLLGATGAGSGTGATYIVFGDTGLSNLDLAAPGTAADRLDGAAVETFSGFSVAGRLDLNGDKGPDVLVGAPTSDTNGVDSGSVYAVFGEPPVAPPPPVGPTPPTPTPAPTAAATLWVKARKASRAIPRTGKVTLVRAVTTGVGQNRGITARVKPKRVKKALKVRVAHTRVTVRTRKAPKSRITVTITATGPGVTPTTWRRTWKVR